MEVRTPASASNDAGDRAETARGFAFALSAYTLWGLIPIYVRAIDTIPPADIVAYRILFSIPIAGLVLWWLGRTHDLKMAFRHPRTILMAALTASLIALNWGVYTWAIVVDRTVEAALGYYINPLVNILFGAFLLGERFNRWQLTAIALAVVAVAILTVNAGGLPWISLALALSFGTYGYFRKTLPIGPSQGFLLEVLILSVPSLAFLFWISPTAGQVLFGGGAEQTLLILLSGPATAVPLILFAFGARQLRYSTIGLMQYVAPTLIFLIAVFVFREPFSGWQFVAFCLIWIALAIYSWSMIRTPRSGETT